MEISHGNQPAALQSESSIDLAVPACLHGIMHLQRLSTTLADSGEWERFHDISRESQDTLAEMNAALGSLRQWQKQRITAPATPELGAASSAWNSFKAYETPHEETTDHESSSLEANVGFGCCHKPQLRVLDGSNVNEEDALAVICKVLYVYRSTRTNRPAVRHVNQSCCWHR